MKCYETVIFWVEKVGHEMSVKILNYHRSVLSWPTTSPL